MIGRLHGRAAFHRLRADGVRVRAGALTCTFVSDPSMTDTRIAFAIGRAVGPAVLRNRIRRRLRAALAEWPVDLPAAWVVLSVRPGAGDRLATAPFDEIRATVEHLFDQIGRRVPGATPCDA